MLNLEKQRERSRKYARSEKGRIRNREWQKTEKRRRYHRNWTRNKRLTDPVWRDKSNARDRQRNTSEKGRAKSRERSKRRRKDPKHREWSILYKRRWRQKKKLEQDPNYLASVQRSQARDRELYHSDPKRRAIVSEQNRRWRENKKKNDPVYWEYRRLRDNELVRLQLQDPEYRARYTARKKREKQKRFEKDPEGYLKWQRETRRKYFQKPKVRQRITDPVVKAHRKKQAKRSHDKRMQNPIHRMRARFYHREVRKANPERERLSKLRHRARVKLLKNPEILIQAVLAQLIQLGFPASILKGVSQ